MNEIDQCQKGVKRGAIRKSSQSEATGPSIDGCPPHRFNLLVIALSVCSQPATQLISI